MRTLIVLSDSFSNSRHAKRAPVRRSWTTSPIVPPRVDRCASSAAVSAARSSVPRRPRAGADVAAPAVDADGRAGARPEREPRRHPDRGAGEGRLDEQPTGQRT